MKKTITLTLDSRLVSRAKAIAAQRGLSVSALVARELEKLQDVEQLYLQARRNALAQLRQPLDIDGNDPTGRNGLPERTRR